MDHTHSCIIIDSVQQARIFTGLNGAGSVRIVGLSPKICRALDLAGFETDNSLDYFSGESHKSILLKSRDIMGWLRGNVEFVKPAHCDSDFLSNSYMFYARFILHHILYCIEIVDNVIKERSPKEFYRFEDMPKGSSLMIEENESIMQDIIS